MRASISRSGAATILADAALKQEPGTDQFEPEWWRAQGAAEPLDGGRGGVWSLDASAAGGASGERWVLRHYRRGGMVGRLLDDGYLRTPLEASRAFREWRLLAHVVIQGLPVPRPVAARVVATGLVVRQDLITHRVADATTLAAALDAGDTVDWEAVGRAIGRLHAAGIDHADLNAHNLLLSPLGVTVIDLDRGRLRALAHRWQEDDLRRLRRSLEKLASLAGRQVEDAGWTALLRGHRSAVRSSA